MEDDGSETSEDAAAASSAKDDRVGSDAMTASASLGRLAVC